jgi:hypothetical protein
MNGFAIIFLGFIGFGVLHTHVRSVVIELILYSHAHIDYRLHALAMVLPLKLRSANRY